jgi:hypothetical protein
MQKTMTVGNPMFPAAFQVHQFVHQLEKASVELMQAGRLGN